MVVGTREEGRGCVSDRDASTEREGKGDDRRRKEKRRERECGEGKERNE